MASKIGVIGSGIVGETLSNGFLRHGYEVMRGTREPAKLAGWKSGAGAKASVGTFADAATFGEIVVLAVKGAAGEAAVKACGSGLDGKPVIDTTNPIAEQAPVNGVLSFFTSLDESLLERLQKLAPKARLVKSFSCVGNVSMVNPDFGGTKPTMFICGNDATAKAEVTKILQQFGWEWEDLGAVEAARAIEPLCILWCIPGMLRNEWTHALKMLHK